MNVLSVFFSLLLLVVTFGCAHTDFSSAYRRAIQEGAKAKVTVKVSDDSGLPVPDANVTAYFDMITKKGAVIRGVTDAAGTYAAEGLCADYMVATVTKENFYETRIQYNDIRSRDPERLKGGRWLPWNPTIPVVLKAVRDPVHMLLHFKDVSIPDFDAPLGFDLEKHDWVTPVGNGQVADMVVRFESLDGNVPFRKLVVEFPGEMNGAYVRKKDDYSILKSDYHAMTNAFYEQRIENADGARGPAHVLLGGDDYLVFRIRSRVDQDGNLVSALYGKIYGPFDCFMNYRDKMRFISFLNPAENDTNLEFDGAGYGDGSLFGR